MASIAHPGRKPSCAHAWDTSLDSTQWKGLRTKGQGMADRMVKDLGQLLHEWGLDTLRPSSLQKPQGLQPPSSRSSQGKAEVVPDMDWERALWFLPHNSRDPKADMGMLMVEEVPPVDYYTHIHQPPVLFPEAGYSLGSTCAGVMLCFWAAAEDTAQANSLIWSGRAVMQIVQLSCCLPLAVWCRP